MIGVLVIILLYSRCALVCLFRCSMLNELRELYCFGAWGCCRCL